MCSVIAEQNRDVNKRKEPFAPKDFFFSLRQGEATKKQGKSAQPWQQQLAFAQAMHQAMGGKGKPSK